MLSTEAPMDEDGFLNVHVKYTGTHSGTTLVVPSRPFLPPLLPQGRELNVTCKWRVKLAGTRLKEIRVCGDPLEVGMEGWYVQLGGKIRGAKPAAAVAQDPPSAKASFRNGLQGQRAAAIQGS